MARAGAAAVLALAVCCLLVSPAPARRPADLPPRALHAVADREAAAEPLRPKPVDCADAAEAEKATAVAVPEEEPRRQRSSSLLCLVFRCGGELARVSGALVARSSSEEPQALDEGTWPAGPGKAEAEAEAEAEDEDHRPYDTDWDSDRDSDDDSDSDSDSDDEGEEDGVLGWLWRLADRF